MLDTDISGIDKPGNYTNITKVIYQNTYMCMPCVAVSAHDVRVSINLNFLTC